MVYSHLEIPSRKPVSNERIYRNTVPSQIK